MGVYVRGGQLVDDWKNVTCVRFDDPRARAGLQMYIDLSQKYRVNPTPQAVKEFGLHYAQLFTQGKVGMVFTGWWVDVSAAKFDWDIAINPYGPEGTRGFMGGGRAYGIASTSKHPDEAYELVKFLCYDPRCIRLRALNPITNQMKKGGTSGYPQSSRWDITKEMFEKYKDYPPRNKMWIVETMQYLRQTPISPRWPEVREKLLLSGAGPFGLAVQGKISLDEAMEEMVREGNRILSEQE